MSKNNDDDDNNQNPIDKSLGINSPKDFGKIIKDMETKAKNDSAANDFDSARKTISSILETGQEAIAELATIASTSQDNKDYTALAGMVSTLTNAATSLLRLHETLRKIEKADQPNNEEAKKMQDEDNPFMTGTTADITKFKLTQRQ